VRCPSIISEYLSNVTVCVVGTAVAVDVETTLVDAEVTAVGASPSAVLALLDAAVPATKPHTASDTEAKNAMPRWARGSLLETTVSSFVASKPGGRQLGKCSWGNLLDYVGS